MKPIDRARAYIGKIPGAVSGQGGHDRTYHVASILVDGFALHDEDAWELLLEYNQRCAPPWSPAQLRHKLQDAVRAVSSEPKGNLLYAPRVPYVEGIIKVPTRSSSGQAGVIPLEHLLGVRKDLEVEVGTAGTPPQKSHTHETTNNPVFPRAHAQELECGVPGVPEANKTSPQQQVGQDSGEFYRVEYIWPPPGATEFDPETGYPIIDGAICPF